MDPLRDPHVEALYYDISTGEGVSFDNPPPLTVSNHLGRFELASGTLTLRPAEHYASGEEARAVIEPFLRAWELDSDLTKNIGAIRFKFVSVHKIDRNPPPPASGDLTVSVAVGGDLVAIGEVASVHIAQHSYPIPPADFRTTPEVELAYNRWRAFRAGREPLQSMAYAVLTLLELIAGGRRKAASTFSLDPAILVTIGRLSSTKGDATTIRKFKAGVQLQPLAGSESSWLEAAVRSVVRRIGEHAAGVPLTQLTMQHLPTL